MSTASERTPAARPTAERGAAKKRQAAELYAEGQSTYEIGESFGVSATTIANWLNDLAIPRRPVVDPERLRELEQNRIRARRVERGLTRRELAARAGVSASALTGIENGHHRPSVELAQGLADALDAELEDLFELRVCACGCGGLMIDQARLGSSARFMCGHNTRTTGHGETVRRGHQARRARLGIPEEKTCERCGQTFTRSDVPNQSDAHWLARRYCSGDCRWPIRVEVEPCAYCGAPFKPHHRGHTRFCSRRHAQLARWQRVTDIADAVIAALPPRARQVWFGRKKGRQFGKLGGRPRAYSEEQRQRVLDLRAKGLSIRQIAITAGLTKDQIARIAAASKVSRNPF